MVNEIGLEVGTDDEVGVELESSMDNGVIRAASDVFAFDAAFGVFAFDDILSQSYDGKPESKWP